MYDEVVIAMLIHHLKGTLNNIAKIKNINNENTLYPINFIIYLMIKVNPPPKTTQNRNDNEMTNKIIEQIIFTIFKCCCLNNLSEKRVNTSTIQNKVVLKI